MKEKALTLIQTPKVKMKMRVSTLTSARKRKSRRSISIISDDLTIFAYML